jgi:hypothetical protein
MEWVSPKGRMALLTSRSRPCPHGLQMSGDHPCSTILSLTGKRTTTQPK